MKSQLYPLLKDNWSDVEDKVLKDERYQACFQTIHDEYMKMKEEGLVDQDLKLGFLEGRHYLKYGKTYIDFSLEGRKKKSIISQIKDLNKEPLIKEIVYQCNCVYNYALDELLDPIVLWKELTQEAGIATLHAKRFHDCIQKDSVDISIYKDILSVSLGVCHVSEDIERVYLVFHRFGDDRAGRFKKYYVDKDKVKCNRHSEIMIEVKVGEVKEFKSYTSQKKEV